MRVQPVASPQAPAGQLFRSAVQAATAEGRGIATRMIANALKLLQARELASRDLSERDALADSVRLLRERQADLCQQFPQALLQVFSALDSRSRTVPPRAIEVPFEELELMDDAQVQDSVAAVRLLQSIALVVESSLTELNALICTTLGLGEVHPERNPLRPESFIQALQEILVQTAVPATVRRIWLGALGANLGPELKALYERLCAQLRAQGVLAAGYAVPHNSAGTGIDQSSSKVAPTPGLRTHRRDESVLTLDRLRSLLAGELDGDSSSNRLDAFARQFARQFEGESVLESKATTDFAATIPAALEALQQMQQVEKVVQKLEQRRGSGEMARIGTTDPLEWERQAIRRSARNPAQALSLEVVTLMVDNIAHDSRLLKPVQLLVRGLEPALLRLSLVDPRFFSEKDHPARRLLQEMTHRSLAFDSADTSGFRVFMQELEAAVQPLAGVEISDNVPFQRVLDGLQQSWAQAARQKEHARADAVHALQHAEARNVLAEKIARSIDQHPEAAQVPEVVLDFLCGPWAQVVAQARIEEGGGSELGDKYQSLISALLWSAHPELARNNVNKLTKLVPRLLATLREGLDSIHYPPLLTSAFFEALMVIHQRAFDHRSTTGTRLSEPVADAQSVRQQSLTRLRASFVESGEPWVAPQEAKASNFLEISAEAAPEKTPTDEFDDLPLGSWVELQTGGNWARTQLTWSSPHGTLFLFTNSVGNMQSMTRKSRDRLVAGGQLRLISGQPVVDGALDAVAKTALQNSLDAPSTRSP